MNIFWQQFVISIVTGGLSAVIIGIIISFNENRK